MCMTPGGCGGTKSKQPASRAKPYTPPRTSGGTYRPSAGNPFSGGGGFGAPTVRLSFSGRRK